jgi:DNA-binding MarR family transcriptional regulator
MSSSLEALGLLIKKVQHRHHRALDARLGSLGISLVQWNALREIDRNPGSSQLRLAELTFNSAQAFGTLTTRLLRMGWVERRPGEGRATVHALTPKGKTLLRQGRELYLEVLLTSFAPLDEDERAVLMRLLTKMLDAQLPVEPEARGASRGARSS